MPVILPEEQIPAGGAPGLIRDIGCEPEMSRHQTQAKAFGPGY
jgi:hypothetical protein